MCVAIVVPDKTSTVPDKDTLEACELQNPDGGGIAWLDGGKVHWKKGINTEEILKIIAKTKPPYLIHYRISTVGGKVKELCHPFPISKGAPTDLSGKCSAALIHNGHWGGWRERTITLQPNGQKIPSGPWSDTRAMAYLSSIYGPDILTFVDEKVAILHGTGAIESWGTWQKEGDCFYSNLSWKHSKKSKKNKMDTDPAYSAYMQRSHYHGWPDNDPEVGKRKSEQNVLDFGKDRLCSDFVRESTDPSIGAKLVAAAETGQSSGKTPGEIEKDLALIISDNAEVKTTGNAAGDMLVTGSKVGV